MNGMVPQIIPIKTATPVHWKCFMSLVPHSENRTEHTSGRAKQVWFVTLHFIQMVRGHAMSMVDCNIERGGRLFGWTIVDMMDVHFHSFRQFREWVVRAASLCHFKKAGLTNILVRYNFKSGIVEIDPALWE